MTGVTMTMDSVHDVSTPNAAKSGRFKIGGELEVNQLGFGAMRVTGPGIWGEPVDRAEAAIKQLPGTSKVAHLEENVAAVNVTLSDDAFAELERAGRKRQ